MSTASSWLPFVTAAIGVVGTLAGATITQIWATKRENERWRQNKTDEEGRQQREDRLRFLEDKKEVYATFLGRMHVWHRQMRSQLHGDYGRQAYDDDGLDDFLSQIMTLLAQIELISPKRVSSQAEVLYGLGAATALTLALPDRYSAEKRTSNVGEYVKNLHECIHLMRSDLGMGHLLDHGPSLHADNPRPAATEN